MIGIPICKKIMGPNGNWWIDEQGNMFIKGDLVVEGGIDPTFFSFVSQGSAVTNNSMVVVSNVLDYRNNTGSVQVVQLSALPDAAATSTDTDVAQSSPPNLFTDQVVTDTITMDNNTNKVWVIAGFVWAKGSDEQQGGSISGRVAVTPVEISTTITSNGSIGGTVFQYVDSPASTGVKTYNINGSKDDPLTAKMFGASVALVEVK